MATYTPKTNKIESQSVVDRDFQVLRYNKSSYQIADNRPETVVQNLLKAKAENSPQSAKVKAIQKIANGKTQQGQAAPIQRAVFSVYRRAPADQEEAARDRQEVNTFVIESSHAANAGQPKGDLMTESGTLEGIPNAESVIITGHGNVRTIQGYSGAEVAARLKTSWKLPKAYSGMITLSSCKAGDKGFWTRSSLVAEVSNNLYGYSASVMGLKGNVITDSTGRDRSVGSDQNLAEYRNKKAELQKCKAAFELEVKNATEDLRFDLMSVRTSIMVIDAKQFKKPQGTVETIATGFSSLMSSGAGLLGIKGEPSDAEKLKTLEERKQKIEAEIEKVARKIEAKYQPLIDHIQAQMDLEGIPSGDPDITVVHGPQGRSMAFGQLSEEWVQFLLSEAASVDQQVPVEGPDLV